MVQVIFLEDENNIGCISPRDTIEAACFKAVGFNVGVKPHPQATKLLFRDIMLKDQREITSHPLSVNNVESNLNATYLSRYYPLIEDLTIPTFFCKDLDSRTEDEIRSRGWTKAFIKNDIKSLFTVSNTASVWPDNTFETMKSLFRHIPEGSGLYAVRKYIDESYMYEEQRYWVINNHPYHESGHIPDLVKEAVKRLEVMGNRYYTLDAIRDYIVEINPGESSDRGGCNSAESLAAWFAKEFL